MAKASARKRPTKNEEIFAHCMPRNGSNFEQFGLGIKPKRPPPPPLPPSLPPSIDPSIHPTIHPSIQPSIHRRNRPHLLHSIYLPYLHRFLPWILPQFLPSALPPPASIIPPPVGIRSTWANTGRCNMNRNFSLFFQINVSLICVIWEQLLLDIPFHICFAFSLLFLSGHNVASAIRMKESRDEASRALAS